MYARGMDFNGVSITKNGRNGDFEVYSYLGWMLLEALTQSNFIYEVIYLSYANALWTPPGLPRIRICRYPPHFLMENGDTLWVQVVGVGQIQIMDKSYDRNTLPYRWALRQGRPNLINLAAFPYKGDASATPQPDIRPCHPERSDNCAGAQAPVRISALTGTEKRGKRSQTDAIDIRKWKQEGDASASPQHDKRLCHPERRDTCDSEDLTDRKSKIINLQFF